MKLLCLALLGIAVRGDHAVTKVVRLLESMLVKSKADGDTDHELYAKFKCYCDDEKDTKTKEIEGLSTEISMLESKIEGLKGSTGALSTETAKLKADKAANMQAQATAQKLRDEEYTAFKATEEDLTYSISQMTQAISVLSEVGADQTYSEGAADHSYFMANKKVSMLKLSAKVRDALTAASALASPGKQRDTLTALLQKPFTGTYTAQSGEVVGVLKSMKDTFTYNLKEATATENAQKEAFNKFMAAKVQAYKEMSDLYDAKQASLGSNDGDLSSSKQSLAESKEQKAIKTQFLQELEPMCEERAKEYMHRKALRANEDAAIAEAIAILDSDNSFNTFGKVSATTSGDTGPKSLLQRSSFLRKGSTLRLEERSRRRAQQVLVGCGSLRVAQLGASLAAGNPFDVVLAEIGKMLKLISKESESDSQTLTTCRSERASSNAALEGIKGQITTLLGTIDELTIAINDPVSGLKVTIAGDEASLAENAASQKTSAEARAKENAAYTEDIGNLQESQALLTKAIKVLSDYYATLEPLQLEEAKGIQKLSGEEEASPETWEAEKGYKGQSQGGARAVAMLEFIQSEVKKEEQQAHSDELKSNTAYEELMSGLKQEESRLEESIATLKNTLAAKEMELFEAQKDLKDTEAEKAATLAYLASIKAGCDFMELNFDLRESRRAAEAVALKKAIELLNDTPAFKAAVAAADVEALGDCKDVCKASLEHVECKACRAKVTVPGYCAGHPGSLGC